MQSIIIYTGETETAVTAKEAAAPMAGTAVRALGMGTAAGRPPSCNCSPLRRLTCNWTGCPAKHRAKMQTIAITTTLMQIQIMMIAQSRNPSSTSVWGKTVVSISAKGNCGRKSTKSAIFADSVIHKKFKENMKISN
jgi:hypothetical protein